MTSPFPSTSCTVPPTSLQVRIEPVYWKRFQHTDKNAGEVQECNSDYDDLISGK